jgi:hypothetical protein
VDVDARLVGRVTIGLVLVALATLAVVFFVAGVHHNSQITSLRTQGVRVTVTVTACQGQLGGSGSNVAGYTCRGTFTLDGRRHTEILAGNALHAPGSTEEAVTVAGDPALLSPVATVAAEHASATVFILPAVLLVVFVALAGALVLRHRRRPEASPQPPSTH